MLRILEILVILAIVIYGGIKLIEMFSFKKKANKRASSLEELKTKAKKAAEEKSKILEKSGSYKITPMMQKHLDKYINTEDITDLDKAATEYLRTLPGVSYRSLYDFATQNKEAFIKGAKWQQKRNYSEEELISAFEAGHDSARLQGSYKLNGTYQEDLNKFLKDNGKD